MKYSGEFYGCLSRGDGKQAVETLLSELYFNTEFQRDNGDNWYTVEDNDTYNAEAHYKFCQHSRLCHIQIIAANKQTLRSLTQAFANLADEYLEYWYCTGDTVGSEHSDRSFKSIHEIENMLRAYIFKKLVLVHAADWEAHLGLHRARVRKAKERQASASNTGPGEYVPNLNVLFYVDLSDLIQVLKKATDDDNPPGEVFSESLIRQQVDELEDLRQIRNDMAHNRYLSEAAFQRVNRETVAARRALEDDTRSLVSL